MDRISQMNASIDFIETHITEEINIDTLAKIAASSKYDYLRMFSFITGTSLTEYLRRRRLSLAAIELQSSAIKILDLALKYGYGSPDAFTRAFQKVHGMTPTSARKSNLQLTLFPRIRFLTPSLDQCKILHKTVPNQHFKLITKGHSISSSLEIAAMWQDFKKDGTLRTLNSFSTNAYYGITHYDDKGCTYSIGSDFNDAPIPDGYEVTEISSPLWATFDMPWLLTRAQQMVKNSDEVGIYIVPPELEESILNFYYEWLNKSDYEEIGEYELQINYLDSKLQVSHMEYWVPIKRAHS